MFVFPKMENANTHADGGVRHPFGGAARGLRGAAAAAAAAARCIDAKRDGLFQTTQLRPRLRLAPSSAKELGGATRAPKVL